MCNDLRTFYNSHSIKLKAKERCGEANGLEWYVKSPDIYLGVHLEKQICKVLIDIINE